MDGKQYTVVRAFNSFAADGSGQQTFITGGNAHLIPELLSAEEIAYRLEAGDIAENAVQSGPPQTSFVHPASLEAPANPTPSVPVGSPLSIGRGKASSAPAVEI